MDTRRTETPVSDLRGLAPPPESGSDDQRSIGLLIVHGIGEQAEGETARKLIDGLRYVYGGNHVDDRGENPISVTIGGSERTVRLYEVYWADVLSGKAEGNFDLKTLSSVPWLPHCSLRAGLFGDTPPTRFSVLVGGAFFHVLSACVYFGYYGSHALTILWLTVSGTYLLLYGLLLLLYGTLRNVVVLGYHLTAIVFWIAIGFFGRPFRRRESRSSASSTDQPRSLLRDVHLNATNETARARPARAREPPGKRDWLGRHPVDVKLDQYLGDIFSYVKSLGLFENPMYGYAILGRFHTALRRACQDCDEVQILSHSLGTVIMYHGLTGHCLAPIGAEAIGTGDDPLAKLTRIYTIGSPLDKMWRFWPRLVKRTIDTRLVFHGGAPRQAPWTASTAAFQWDNFHNPLDPVADSLGGFRGWPTVRNHRVWGGGAARSHTIYEWNDAFLGVVAKGVFATTATPRTDRPHRGWDHFVSGIESASAAGVFSAIVVCGFVYGLVAAWLFSWLAGWPFRLMSSDLATTVEDWAFAVFAFGLTLAAFILGRKQAVKDHERWLALSTDRVLEAAMDWFDRGFAKFMARDLQGAEHDLTVTVQMAPSFARGYIQRGFVLAARNEFNLALADFERAIELDPLIGEGYFGRGIVKDQLQDTLGAIADYSRAIELNPRHRRAYLRRGQLRGELMEYEAAVLDLDSMAGCFQGSEQETCLT